MRDYYSSTSHLKDYLDLYYVGTIMAQDVCEAHFKFQPLKKIGEYTTSHDNRHIYPMNTECMYYFTPHRHYSHSVYSRRNTIWVHLKVSSALDNRALLQQCQSVIPALILRTH